MKLIFGFSRPRTFKIFAKIIELVDKRPFSHSYVRLLDPYGDEVVFQASGLAVNLDSYAGFCSVEMPVEEYEMDINDNQRQKVWAYIVSRLDIPYSVMQIIRIGIKKLTGIKLGGDGEKAEVCSELAARLCEFLGKDVPGDLDYIDPSGFREFCKNNLTRIL